MSANLMKGKVLPIGVDLGTASVKMAQMRALPTGRYSLVASGFAEVPPAARRQPAERGRFFVGAIRRLFSDHPFKGKQCILSLPAEATFVQHIKVAQMPTDELIASLQWELQGKLPYDPSRAIVRHVVAGEVFEAEEVKQEVIVMAANRDVVDLHLQLIRRTKLDCVGINVEPCAIVECFARLFRRSEDVDRATMFIDIGSASTQVVICHGSQLAFAKNLFIGSAQFDQAVAAGLNIPLDEAHRRRGVLAQGENIDGAQQILQLLTGPMNDMAKELTSCLRYYESVFSNRAVERVVFLGGQAYDKRLCQMLAQRLSMPAQIGDPLASIPREPGAEAGIGTVGEGGLPDWSVAVGLSLGAMVQEGANTRRKEAARV